MTDDVAESVALEAKREARSPAQIAGQALRFFVSLPRDARASLAAIENLGTADERRQAVNEVARALNVAEFEVTCHRMATRARELVSDDATEENLDKASVDLTRSIVTLG